MDEPVNNQNNGKNIKRDNNHINIHDQWSPSFKNYKSVLYRYLNKSLYNLKKKILYF